MAPAPAPLLRVRLRRVLLRPTAVAWAGRALGPLLWWPLLVAFGLGVAAADVALLRSGDIGRVPTHLRDAHYPGAKRLGHGKGYRYAHDAPAGVATQQHLPDPLVGRRYYEPGAHGYERDVAARLERIRRILSGDA